MLYRLSIKGKLHIKQFGIMKHLTNLLYKRNKKNLPAKAEEKIKETKTTLIN